MEKDTFLEVVNFFYQIAFITDNLAAFIAIIVVIAELHHFGLS
jgi:hypothetical protein